MDELISRQAAIEALADMHCKSDEDGYVWIIRSDAWGRIDALPSAQPEHHYCRECKWSRCHINVDKNGNTESYWRCLNWDGGTDEEGYCYEWEGRTDDEG